MSDDTPQADEQGGHSFPAATGPAPLLPMQSTTAYLMLRQDVISDLQAENAHLRAQLAEARAVLAALRDQYVHPGSAGDCTVMVQFTAAQVRAGKRLLLEETA